MRNKTTKDTTSNGSLTVSTSDDLAGGVGVGVGVLDGGGVGRHGGDGHLGGAGGHDDVADGAEGLEGADVLQEKSTKGGERGLRSVCECAIALGTVRTCRWLASPSIPHVK